MFKLKSLKYCILLYIFILSVPVKAQEILKPVYFSAPDSLPNVTALMKTPEFWIARHPYPDSLIMTQKQITAFNLKAKQRSGAVSNLIELATGFSEKSVKKEIIRHIDYNRRRKLYDTAGNRIGRQYYAQLRDSMGISSKTTRNKMMVGFAVNFADQKVFPTEDTIMAKPYDFEFNEFQNSGYDAGTPLIFYFYSKNKQWIYGSSSTTIGWFRTRDVVVTSLAEWKDYVGFKDNIVITASRAKVWADAGRTELICTLRMGCVLPCMLRTDGLYYAILPRNNEDGTYPMQAVFVSASDASRGYLPYTPANVYHQAFKLLDEPYGWGDTNGNWDCSSLLKSLYSVFGIYLPRNGKNQVLSGSDLYKFDGSMSRTDKEFFLASRAVGALTLLRLEGHIMLNLGSVNGKTYALHDIWGYRKPVPGKDNDIYVINKTVVSDLYLGENSIKGSLLERITHISLLK